MRKSFLTSLFLALALALAGGAFAADPSLQEVHAAAQAGRMSEALSMMDKVLENHPNSGKAHYVEAELLAKEGRLSSARAELSTAERLSPGLSFAKPEAVRELKARIAGAPATAAPLAAPTASGISPGLVLLAVGALVFLFFAARALIRRSSSPAPGGARFGAGPAGANVPYGSAAPYGPAPVAPAQGGLGSGILGGLATGAAMGAGLVAGEALAHNLMDGGHRNTPAAPAMDKGWDDGNYDMGGNDFGVSDAGSWDDGGSSGGDSGGDGW